MDSLLLKGESKGFTLLELMVSVSILSILAVIAVTIYINYTRRAYYTEIVHATAPYTIAVAECYQSLKSFTGCNGGTNNIPANISTQMGNVASLTVTNGVITVTPVTTHGFLSTDTYILTPTIGSNNVVTWTSSGGGVTSGYAQ